MTEAPARLLSWDSDFFGFPIAELLVDRLDETLLAAVREWIAAQRVRCTYFTADLGDRGTMEIASRQDWFLADIRLLYHLPRRDFGPPPAQGSDPAVREAQPEDLDQVRALFREVAQVSRFHFDDRFPAGKAAEMYEQWMEPAGSSLATDRIAVAGRVGEVAGAVLYRIAERCDNGGRRGELVLVGVFGSRRLEGFGRALVDHACTRMFDAGCDDVVVVTQGRNIASQRLYARRGFRIESMNAMYHIWSKDGAE